MLHMTPFLFSVTWSLIADAHIDRYASKAYILQKFHFFTEELKPSIMNEYNRTLKSIQ